MQNSKRSLKFFTYFIPGVLFFLFLIDSASAVTLGISGNRFTLNGQPKFLVLSGYWDGLDASNPSADLNWLKSKGFDGIRIFPNLWDYCPNCSQRYTPSSNTVMNPDGSIDQTRLNQLISIVNTANSLGMIVDITFARETVAGAGCTASAGNEVMCVPEFKRGMISVMNALNSKTNVFYDIQNEYDHPAIDLSNADIGNIKSGLPSGRILSVSSGDPSGPTAISNADYFGMNLVNVHFAGGQELNTNLSSSVISNKPTYIGEPYHTDSISNYTTSDLIDGVVNAKRVGIAVWLFHSNASFGLDGTSIQSNFMSNEMGFVNQFSQALQNVTWGGGGGQPPSSPPPPSGGGNCINPAPAASTVPDMSATVDSVAYDHPDWLESSCDDFRYLDEVVRRLRAGTGGTRWAFEGKRANLNDPWKEGISYYYGSGNAPQTGSMANYEVFAIDVAHQDCANTANIRPDFNVADWPYKNTGVVEVAYLYPRNGGGSLPSPVLCSDQPPPVPPQPPPPPAPVPTPTGPPTITGISPQTAVVGQTVEIFGTNLVDSVRLENSSDGRFYSVATAINMGATIASFEVPDLAGGIYKILMSGSQGSTESPQNLTVRTGGTPFDQPSQPGIPTEGLLGFGQLIAAIFTWSLNILGTVVFVMIFYAGFMWFTAAGNTAQVNEARGRITNAITGAIILLAAYIILYTINPDLVGGTFTLPGLGTTQQTQP